MINTIRLRCTIGWLAILLPWLVSLLTCTIPCSISETYYTYEAGAVFMIVLGSASFLLFAYKGYELIDDIINSIAGLFGLLICLFPCFPLDLSLENVGTFQVHRLTSLTIHNISAIAFFGLLAYNSLFLFTKSNGVLTKNKKIRNIIYRICGIGMLSAFLIMLMPYFRIQIWLTETIALFFFGISFLTKADYYTWLFADRK